MIVRRFYITFWKTQILSKPYIGLAEKYRLTAIASQNDVINRIGYMNLRIKWHPCLVGSWLSYSLRLRHPVLPFVKTGINTQILNTGTCIKNHKSFIIERNR